MLFSYQSKTPLVDFTFSRTGGTNKWSLVLRGLLKMKTCTHTTDYSSPLGAIRYIICSFVLPHLVQWADSGAPLQQPHCGRCRCSCRCGRASGWRFAVSWWSRCCPQSRPGWRGLAVHLSARWCPGGGRPTWPRRGWRHAGRWWNAGTQRAECREGLTDRKTHRRSNVISKTILILWILWQVLRPFLRAILQSSNYLALKRSLKEHKRPE